MTGLIKGYESLLYMLVTFLLLCFAVAEKGVTEEEASNRLFDTVDLAVACIAALTYLPLDVSNQATIAGKNKVFHSVYVT